MTAALTESAVFVALRTVVLEVTGLDAANVFRAPAQLPQRRDPYVAMRRVTNAAVGRTFETSPGTYRQHRALTVQLDAVGEGAHDAVLALHSVLRSRAPARAALLAAEVGVAGLGAVRDLSRLAPSGWEPMIGFDLRLSYVQQLELEPTATADHIRVEARSVGDEVHDLGVIYDDLAGHDIAALSLISTASGGLFPQLASIVPL